MEETSNKRYVLLICLGLILCSFVAYEPMRHNGFVGYDDEDYVTNNEHVLSGLNSESIVWAFTTPHVSNWHPVTWISHMVDCQLFGVNALGHHITNLLLHIINTLLLFLLFKRMTRAVWASAFVAAVFALHPLHVESVAWIAERKDVLSAFFCILTIWAYVRYTERVSFGRFAVVMVLFALGLMSKPMVVTLPFVLLLLDYWPLCRFKNVGRLIAEKLPLFALAATSSIITFIVQKNYGAVAQTETVGLGLRASNAIVSYVMYITKMVWPSGLAVLYPLSNETLPLQQWVVSLIIVLVVSIGVIWTTKQQRYLTTGWLWYVGTLIPVIGLVQVGSQAMADRYMYLPLVGLSIMIAWGIGEFSERWRYQKIIVAIGMIGVVAAMVICTRTQVTYWEKNTTLFERALAVTKNNYVMHYNLGRELHKQDRFDEAIGHYNRTLRIEPRHIKAYNNLGLALKSQGKFDEAINSFNEAIKVAPGYSDTYNNLAVTLQSQGKLDDAIIYFAHALEIDRNSVLAHNNLGEALAEQGKFEEAISHFNRALEIDGDSAAAYNNLGVTFQSQGKFYEAVKYFRKALQINPNYADAHNNLGIVFGAQGRLDEAISHLRQALEIEPNSTETHFNLGMALRFAGKFDEAISHFRQALQVGAEDAGVHYNLAMAFKSQGKFNEAISHFRQSLELNTNSADAHYNLAITLVVTSNTNEAIKHFQEAVRLNPNWWEPLNGLAWLLSTHLEKPRSKEAIFLAERAAELTKYQNAYALDTLAASYASGKQFKKAISTAELAMESARAASIEPLLKEIASRLELYKQKKPYRALGQK